MKGATCYKNDLENLRATELTLRPPGIDVEEVIRSASIATKCKKRALSEKKETDENEQATEPVAKAQIVGWPPIRAYRMNSFRSRKSLVVDDNNGGIYVKVSMDGVPYLRKIDLKIYEGYEELWRALEDMFKCSSLVPVNYDEPKYAITYEDKDGDWMLVGDVPWEMFISSCKRMRIMKGCEARGQSSSA
ncbi:auxin-induced protein 22D-like [Ananas comosus]|uniref:Auxin-responsive protein n=1 Tax=Ananas comosus TaxID=4615 RepID=A0A6P5GXM6_ANACO|nr:auxin-induced protein 22D-like [Ananas comosus]